jgi:hypothetical protein
MSARQLSDAHVGRSKAELVAQRSFSERVVRRLAGSWRVAPRHATCWSHVPWRRVCDRARRRLIAHRWLASVAGSLLERLFPSHPPDDWAEFSCIHSREGAATSSTGSGYYGGVQMDIGFQRTYGAEFLARWGAADRWPVWAQVVAARRARDGYGGFPARGYGPWPATARACGQL